MLARIAVCAAVLTLSVPSSAQGRPHDADSSYQAANDDSDLSEPTGDDVGADPLEEIPADLMSDDGDGAPADPGDAAPDATPRKPAARSELIAEAAPRPRPARHDDEAAPASQDAALDRVARDCHSERGLFCDRVLADDMKTARCLLQYRDDVLADCQGALDAALPFIEKR